MAMLSPVSRRVTALTGRHSERDILDRLIEALGAGESRALVLRGEPGVGKTALLEYLVEQGPGFRVVRAAGVQSEMELAYAGLQQLLASMLDRLEGLPAPQSEALRTAFGLASGRPADRFFLGLAVLSLLSDVAEEQPLLCVVDDEQWLDRASADVLAFVARRLDRESVGLIFAARTASDQLAGLPELVVGGLSEADAYVLLESILRAPLDARVREQIVSETRGIPLAMLEVLRDLTPAELAGGFGLAGGVPVPSSIEKTFRRRIEALPSDSRRLLQLAAADPVGDPLLVWRAAERLGISTDAATAPAQAGLLEVGARALSPSAGALGGLLVGVASGEAGSAPRPGGSDRPRDRSRPPCLAPGPRCCRPRRGRRRGACPLRRSGAGARRLSGGCRVSRALRRTDARARSPRGTPACGCPSEAGCRGLRSCPGASGNT